MHPFHLAILVHDLDAARAFYGALLGCREGRSAKTWVDFDFFGHQLTAHLRSAAGDSEQASSVDGDRVPLPHFGVVLDPPSWHALAESIERSGIGFVLAPRVRFHGKVGEQSTFFLRDPSGNALEFKAFSRIEGLFERTSQTGDRSPDQGTR